MRCLERAEIDRYVGGTMDPLAADQITEHLKTCRRCRRLAAEQRGSSGAIAGDPAQAEATPADPTPERGAEDAERDGRAERNEKADHRAVVKAQCTACKARYGIPEERVKGRVLKIRCKSCGGIIEVRGPETSRSVLDRGRRLWFVVIQRQRVGPMTEQELRERFERGEIKPRTYAWRQGFQRWERLFAIAELKDLVEPTPAEPPSALVRPKRTTRPLPELAAQAGIREGDTQPGIHEIPTRPGIHEIATRVGEAADRAESTKPAKRRRSEPLPAAEPSSSGELNFDAPIGRALPEELAGSALRTAEKQPLEPVTTEQSAVGEPSTDERLTHIHYKDQDPLAGLEVAAPAEESVAEGEDEKGTEILPRESVAPQEASALAAGDFERHMRGQRGDNSVLFSLAHLRKLAAPQPVSTKRSTGWTGLFDIRPLAAPPPPLMTPVEPPPPRRIGVGVVMAIGFCGVIIGAATLLGGLYLARPEGLRQLLQPRATTPAKVPAEVRAAPPPRAGTGSAVVVAAPRPDARRELRVVAAVIRDAGPAPGTKAEAKPEKVAKAEEKQEKVAKAETKPAKPEKVAKAETKQAKQEKVAKVETKPAETKAADGSAKKAPRRRPKKTDIAVVDPESSAPDGTAKKPEKKKTEKKRPADDQEEIDRLVDAATEGRPPPVSKTDEGSGEDKPSPKAKAKAKTSKTEDAEKTQITREQVAAGMKQAHGGVQACNEKYEQTGMVSIEATIDGRTGRISAGRVVGSFAGTPVGNCVLDAAKRLARFPKFTGPALTLEYPFILR